MTVNQLIDELMQHAMNGYVELPVCRFCYDKMERKYTDQFSYSTLDEEERTVMLF